MKIGNILVNTAYLGNEVLTAIAVGATKLWEAVKYIVFKDPVVAKICAENWGDGVGITPEQAAAVTNIGTVFKDNTEITSFDELKLFGLSEATQSFYGCTNLTSVTLPENLKKIGGYTFYKCPITTINIPENLTEIHTAAFNMSVSSVRNIHLKNIENWMRVKIGEQASFFHGAAETHIYENDNLITEIQIPSDVIDVQYAVLNNAIDLQTLTLHEGIKSISHNAFAGCSSLELGDINLPNLESIGN